MALAGLSARLGTKCLSVPYSKPLPIRLDHHRQATLSHKAGASPDTIQFLGAEIGLCASIQAEQGRTTLPQQNDSLVPRHLIRPVLTTETHKNHATGQDWDSGMKLQEGTLKHLRSLTVTGA